jgi:hypothetical protein
MTGVSQGGTGRLPDPRRCACWRKFLAASAVARGMAGPNWRALRRRLFSCVVATVCMLLFLLFWQFAVPAGPRRHGDGPPDMLFFWAWFAAVALAFPNAVVLAFSASRLLWNARRRGLFGAPVAVLFAAMVGVPIATELSGLGRLVVLWSFPLALFVSLGASASVILFTPSPGGAPPTPPGAEAEVLAAPAVDDEGHAYARDLASPPTRGKAQ